MSFGTVLSRGPRSCLLCWHLPPGDQREWQPQPLGDMGREHRLWGPQSTLTGIQMGERVAGHTSRLCPSSRCLARCGQCFRGHSAARLEEAMKDKFTDRGNSSVCARQGKHSRYIAVHRGRLTIACATALALRNLLLRERASARFTPLKRSAVRLKGGGCGGLRRH